MNKTVWNFANLNLESEIPAMLLYVLESKGSSPGRQGFSMVVNANGQMKGSVGGGIMEHKFVELAKEKLKNNNSVTAHEVRKQIHDKSAAKDQSGMICSGEQTIVLYQLQQKDKAAIKLIIECIDANKNATFKLLPDGIYFEYSLPEKDFELKFNDEDDWLYKEKIGYKNNLYVIGGGHCALAFCRIMRMMDFYIHLYDDRRDLNTMQQNDYAHEKIIVKNYSDLEELIPTGNNNYVVLMTFGYRTDDVAVRALLSKRFKYFGLLGSRKKIEKMFEDYKSEGIDESLLKNIHTPIGIPIKSETPEEIAISIAAEIIRVKNLSVNR